MNSHETITILNHLKIYNHSKIVIIDILGTVFNIKNDFYKNLNENKRKWVTNNLFVLTTLTDKFKRFLHATFTNEYKQMYNEPTDEIDDFRWEKMMQPENPTSAINNKISANTKQSTHEQLNKRFKRDEIENAATKLIIKVLNDSFDGDFIDLIDNVNNTVDNKVKWNDGSFIEIIMHKLINDTCDNANGKYPNNNSNLNLNKLCANLIFNKLKCNLILNHGKRDADEATIKHALKSWCQYFHNKTVDRNANDEINRINENLLHLIPNHNQTKFSEFFNLFDFIVTTLTSMEIIDSINLDNSTSTAATKTTLSSSSTTTTVPTIPSSTLSPSSLSPTFSSSSLSFTPPTNAYDFCVLDFQLTQIDTNGTTSFVWRPFLFLKQQINQNKYITHPLLAGFNHWFYESPRQFWACGILCWILAGLLLLLFVCVVVASISIVITAR